MGSTPSKEQLLTKAIENQDTDSVRTLIEDLTSDQVQSLCKSPVPGNEYHCTLLHYATWQDNPELLTLLLDSTKDLEVCDDLGWTPLIAAVHRDSKENVKLLLERGAKIDCDSMKGMDLVATAMSYNDIELVEILMDHGAQVIMPPDVAVSEGNKTGCYLLHFAVDDGLLDIAKLLIDRGKIPLNTLDQSGWSALHLAAGNNSIEMVKLLLEKKADINIKDQHGNTPLAWAKEMNNQEVIDELVKQGATADEEWHGEKWEWRNSDEQPEDEQELQGVVNHTFRMEESNEDSGLDETNPTDLEIRQEKRQL